LPTSAKDRQFLPPFANPAVSAGFSAPQLTDDPGLSPTVPTCAVELATNRTKGTNSKIIISPSSAFKIGESALASTELVQ
jgi:hypothetical protein